MKRKRVTPCDAPRKDHPNQSESPVKGGRKWPRQIEISPVKIHPIEDVNHMGVKTQPI